MLSAEINCAATQLPLIVLDQIALPDPEPHASSPGETDKDGEVGSQLQLPLKTAEQVLTPGVEPCHGPFFR
mgnify:CR=1 FL=1